MDNRHFARCPLSLCAYLACMDIKHLLTAVEASDILRLTPNQIRKLARGGELPAVVLPGNEVRFDETELWAWVEAHKQPAREASNAK